MFLVYINIPTFCFSPSKIFLQLLVPIKFSITFFSLFLSKLLYFFNEIVQKCIEYCKNHSPKKLDFF